MPRIFVYELVCGGGWQAIDPRGAPPESLLREGRAMLTALVADFAAIEGVKVVTMRDARCPELNLADCGVREIHSADDEQAAICELAAAADWTVLIVPEFDNLLLDRVRWVEKSGGRLLGPPTEIISLCADKQRTCEHLHAAGVPTPPAVPLDDFSSLPANINFPAVLKPRDGAGSQAVRLIDHGIKFQETAREVIRENSRTRAWRLEQYRPGIAASVSVLCGPSGCFPLPPCSQRLSDDGHFRYLGGCCPLPEPLASRATELAGRAVATVRDPVGYIGVDLVLGDDLSGREDFVIEINPRLTTSYVGLRVLAKTNLAAAMLAAARGEHPELTFLPGPIDFDASGKVQNRI